MFLRLGSPKPQFLRCFLLRVANMFLASAYSKNTCIYAVFSMLQEVFLPKTQRHCKLQNLQCFCSWHAPKKQQTPPKSAQDDLQKHLVILASFFPTPGPEKRENTTRVKDCRESSPDLRAYARQPARGPLEGKGAAIEHKEELRVKDRNYRVFFGCHFFRSC